MMAGWERCGMFIFYLLILQKWNGQKVQYTFSNYCISASSLIQAARRCWANHSWIQPQDRLTPLSRFYIFINPKRMKLFFLVLLSLWWVVISPWGKFCSVMCGTSCDGDLKTECKTCQTDGAWQPSSGKTCIVKTSSNWVLFDSTSDLGGGLTVTGASFQDTCYDFQIYGYIKVNQQIKVSSAGIMVPYYAMKVYFGILAFNTICQGCASGQNLYLWSNTSSFTVTFNDPQGNATNNPVTYAIAKNTSTFSGKCDLSNKNKSSWIRVGILYNNYYKTNSLLNWTVTCDEANTSQIWGMRQFLIIYQPCDIKCTQCFGLGATKCTACAATFWLSNNTCAATCLTGFGIGLNNTCVYCDRKCTACYMVAQNCSACTTSGANSAYLSTTANPSYTTCVSSCPPGYSANKTTRTCDQCATGCDSCLNSATYCTNCSSGYFWTGWTCYTTCPAGYFEDANGINCTRCYPFCSVCVGSFNICTSCVVSGSFKAYLFNDTSVNGSCTRLCALASTGYYEEDNGGLGPNLCLKCNDSCSSCTGNPTPCSQCKGGFYLINSACTDTCPNGTIANNGTTGFGQCINCDISCVDLTISMYFPSAVNDEVYIDMQFTQDLDYSTFDYASFQDITITSKNIQYTTSMFNFTYNNLSSSSYRITITPKTYIFLYNATFTVTTKDQPATTEYSLLKLPFKPKVYGMSASLTWFLIKGPPFNNLQKGIMTSFDKLSTKTNNVLTLPYVQQIKKSGVFNLLFSGAQATSLTMLSNQIQSQNLYEGVRIWAIFVFFDAPKYQRISDKTKRFVSPTVQDEIRHAQQLADHSDPRQRQLFSTDSMYWRFQRTGQTSFFIYDVYIPIFLICLCWISLVVANCCKKSKWYHSYAPNLYSAVHKIHQMSILYVTMASIVQFIFFQSSSFQRMVSAISCVVFNIYFLVYQLYIYYDMIKYPMAEIGNQLFDYYVLKYGFFLKTVRYVEYDINQRWSPKHWFRPYNYHILSYYKKCLMIIALPLFYNTLYAQMSVLVCIQLLEMIRFWFTWPFLSTLRNCFRLFLQFCLLIFFVINLIQISVLQTIMQSDADGLASSTAIFYGLGWAGFAFCFFFNAGHICIGIYDFCVGLKDSNRTKMENARKKYYFQKIRSYEKDNQASSKDLVNQWVKMGNLNDKSYGQLPQINIRIQLYQFKKVGFKFHLLIKKITSLSMKQHAKLRKQNNTTVGHKIEKTMVFSQAENNKLYNILNEVYKKYEDPHVQAIRLKTFLNVWQKDYSEGQSIIFDRNLMFQKVELISYQNQSQQQQLPSLFSDFPLDPALLESEA